MLKCWVLEFRISEFLWCMWTHKLPAILVHACFFLQLLLGEFCQSPSRDQVSGFTGTTWIKSRSLTAPNGSYSEIHWTSEWFFGRPWEGFRGVRHLFQTVCALHRKLFASEDGSIPFSDIFWTWLPEGLVSQAGAVMQLLLSHSCCSEVSSGIRCNTQKRGTQAILHWSGSRPGRHQRTPACPCMKLRSASHTSFTAQCITFPSVLPCPSQKVKHWAQHDQGCATTWDQKMPIQAPATQVYPYVSTNNHVETIHNTFNERNLISIGHLQFPCTTSSSQDTHLAWTESDLF